MGRLMDTMKGKAGTPEKYSGGAETPTCGVTMRNLKDCRLSDRSQAGALYDFMSMSYLRQLALPVAHHGAPLTLLQCSG